MNEKRKHEWIPQYAIIPLLSCFAVNCLVYTVIAPIADNWKHYDLTTDFDRAVPVMPAFVVVYLGCYLFWAVNYILIAKQGKEHCMRFVTADIISRLICCVFFLVFPTTNVRPVLEDTGIWTSLLQMVYEMDAPTRLFPSIHCLVSWFCYIGIRGQRSVSKGYRAFSCLFALLVCISTQVTKQHYIVDVIGGIVIAELAWYAACRTQWYRTVEQIFTYLDKIVWKKKSGCEKESGT